MTEPSLAQPKDNVFEAVESLSTPAFVISAGDAPARLNAAAQSLWKTIANTARPPMSDPDGSPLTASPIDRVLAGEWPIPPREVLIHRGDGARIRALLTVTPHDSAALCFVHPLEDPPPSTLLLEAGRVLGNTLDLDESLTQLGRLAVPRLADWCVVSIVDSSGRLRRTFIAHGDPSHAALAKRIEERASSRAIPLAMAHLIGRPYLHLDVDAARRREWAQDDAHLADIEAMDAHSVILVPLLARDRRIGALSLLRSSSSPRFDPADVTLVQELATRLAQTLDHAQLYRESQEARALSEHLADRLSVLATGSSLLVEAGFDFAQACRDMTRLVCEHLGDACILTVSPGDGQPQQPMAIDHRIPKHRDALREATLSGAPGMGLGLARDVYRTGNSIRVPAIDPALLSEVLPVRPQLAKYVNEIGLTSLLVVPLRLNGKVLGTFGMTRDRDGAPYTVEDELLVRDLADRVALLFEKDRLYREAQEALRLRDTFLSVASHELRTPLSTMRLQAQSVLMQVQRGTIHAPPIVVKRFEAIDSQIHRLNTLVEDLLDVSRITSGRLQLEWEEFDLVALSREVSDRFAETLLQAGCSFSFKSSGSLIGRWDRSRVDQVLTNLISNAVKYGSKKPIEMRLEQVGDRARVHVQDHGIGIAPEDQKRIFERFERAVSARSYAGLGLGLWITRQIVLALGGDIIVQSALNAGSTFTVDLPLNVAAEQN